MRERLAPQLGAERILSLFANKWAIRVIHRLAGSAQRPGELRRSLVPISQKVLTQTLRNLERSGFVRRELVRAKPLNVLYSLTPLGRTFVRPLNALCHWALQHQNELALVDHHLARHPSRTSRFPARPSTHG